MCTSHILVLGLIYAVIAAMDISGGQHSLWYFIMTFNGYSTDRRVFTTECYWGPRLNTG
jgi:hypothetical protein